MTAPFPSLGRVAWFSSKVTDGEPLREICDLAAAFSLVGSPVLLGSGIQGYCVEDGIDHRIDYDRRSFDELETRHQQPIIELVRDLARVGPVTLLPFCAYRLSTSLALAIPNVSLLGNPPELEAMFNQKPWVLDQFRKRDIAAIQPFHFTKSAPRDDLPYPVVVSPPSGTGGDGMFFASDPDALAVLLTGADIPEFLSATAYLDRPLSLNVTGCINADGTVSAHPLSLQVIGANICTPRRFGYCGNDFGLVREILSSEQIRRIEQLLDQTGRWMFSFGFRGAFGLDLMLHQGKVLISELNPRFQGSSHLGATLMRRAGYEDVYVQHIRAHLGLKALRGPSLVEIVRAQEPLSQVFCYNGLPYGALPVSSANEEAAGVIEFLPRQNVALDSHSLLFRYLVNSNVLDASGRNLLPQISQKLLRIRGSIADREFAA